MLITHTIIDLHTGRIDRKAVFAGGFGSCFIFSASQYFLRIQHYNTTASPCANPYCEYH
jgi:hypothetical protein